jgi:hypothetical protein
MKIWGKFAKLNVAARLVYHRRILAYFGQWIANTKYSQTLTSNFQWYVSIQAANISSLLFNNYPITGCTIEFAKRKCTWCSKCGEIGH